MSTMRSPPQQRMIGAWPERPGPPSNRRCHQTEEDPMFSETDFQMTMLRNQELVTRGLQEQFVASVLPPSTSTPAVVTVLRQQFGALLMRAGQRLQSGHAVARESLSTVVTAER